MTSPLFVTTQWLNDHLKDPMIAVVDASWYLPVHQRNGKEEYALGHIPGAVYFDIDAIADTTTSLPHMLPTPEHFAALVGAMGISERHHIVVYDGMGLFSAPRVWWTFRVMGAENVSILSGGAPQWKAENRPWTADVSVPTPAVFKPQFDAKEVASIDHIRGALSTGNAQILDARPAERFRGEAPEPRPGLKSGHMPGSLNLPFSEIVTNGQLKPQADLVEAFTKAGIDLDRPVITSCGSGVSAAILALALESVGKPVKALYDGSWAEWGSRADCEVVKG